MSSAGFDGKAFYFQEQDGTRKILLHVAELMGRDGVRSMVAVRRHKGEKEKRAAFLAAVLQVLRALGNDSRALANSLALLLSIDLLSQAHCPHRFLRIGGDPNDALSKCMERVLHLFHPDNRLYFVADEHPLPERFFDAVVIDHLDENIPSDMPRVAMHALKPGGRMLCLTSWPEIIEPIRLADGQVEVFPVEERLFLFTLRQTEESYAQEFRQRFPGFDVPEGYLPPSPEKKTIVFLPYKASMWDSMESIWRAADADRAHCHAYVVPIPYADKDEDVETEEWHDERAMFPTYVPTTDWRELDLARLRPDIIYIHNPYDGSSTVTTVDERFYSPKLRQYTRLLVYVPYFTVGRRWPELHARLPCYAHMDWMVVQRPRMEVMHNPQIPFSTMKAGEVRYLEDFVDPGKLAALGSPKLDRLFYCEEHRALPPGWAERIGGRKVILYNTSISGIGEHGEKFTRKMGYIFDVFAERKEVVLLWRPHPLIEETARKASAKVHGEYLRLKQRFLDEGIGILDTTADVDMAVAVADAYLGEGSSSLVSMFGFVGKPIFLASDMRLWERPSREEMRRVWFGARIMDGDHCYFRPNEYNAFCRLDLGSKQVTPLLNFGEGIHGETYSGPWRDPEDKDKFYFSPDRAKNLLVYDLRTGETRRISLKDSLPMGNLGGMGSHKEYLYFLPNRYPAIVRLHRKTQEISYLPIQHPEPHGNFGRMVAYKEYLYFLPNQYPAIVRLDGKTQELSYFPECMEAFRATRTARHGNVMAGHIVRDGRFLLVPFRLSNQVMELDMETGKWRHIPVGPEDVDSSAIIAEGGDVYWIIPWQKRKIRRWDYATGACEVIDQYPEGYVCAKDWGNGMDSYLFSGTPKVGQEIWLYPSYGNMMLRLDLRQKKLLKWEGITLPPWKEKPTGSFAQQSMFLSVWDFRGKLWAQCSHDRSFLVIDKETKGCTWEPAIQMDAGTANSLMAPLATAFGPVGENIPYAVQENRLGRSVDAFIDYVAQDIHDRSLQREKFAALSNNADGTCGENVHAYMMRQPQDAVPLDLVLGASIDEGSGQIRQGSGTMATEGFALAGRGSRVMLLDRRYAFQVHTYAPEIEPRYLHTYDYAPEEAWVAYLPEAEPQWKAGDYVFPERCYFRVSLRRRDGKPCTAADVDAMRLGIRYLTTEKPSSGKVFPSMVGRAAAEIARIREEGDLCLIVLTDTHVTVNGTWPDTAANLLAVAGRIHPDAIVHLGDLTDGLVSRRQTGKYAKEILGDMGRAGVPVHVALGNHDANYFRNNPDILGIAEQARLYQGRECPYFYVDNERAGVRMIFLSAYDHRARPRYGFDLAQLDWLRDVLGGMPKSRRALVFAHDAPLAELDFWSDEIRHGAELVSICEAYQKQTGNLLGYIHGHTHADAVYAKGSFPIISVGCAKCEDMPEKKPPNSVTWPRALGQPSQELWDVLIVKPGQRRLHFVRFGAGKSRTVMLK